MMNISMYLMGEIEKLSSTSSKSGGEGTQSTPAVSREDILALLKMGNDHERSRASLLNSGEDGYYPEF